MVRSLLAAWSAVLLVPVSLAAMRQGAPPVAVRRPNLVLVTMDTTRADHLGCYGYPRPTTPRIDALALESIVFEDCQATVTITTPSHTSIMTGVYPFEHGVVDFSVKARESLKQQRAFASTPLLRTYAEILSAHGWNTGGFVTAATTKRIAGLAAGFTTWSEPEGEVRLGAEALAEALAWLDQVPEPFFLWLHFFDAHSPPRGGQTRFLEELKADTLLREHMARRGIDPAQRSGAKLSAAERVARVENEIVTYDAGLRLIDDHVSAMRAKLEARGVWSATTVVITGDHGEGLGQHLFESHGPVWHEGTHVPFILKAPGHAPARVATLVSSIDVLVTAIAATPGLPSEEFLAQARGRNALAPDFEERAVFSMAPSKRGEYALKTPRWRWIRRDSGLNALYDLASDPFELKDVRADHPDIAAALDRQLLESIRDQRARNVEFYAGRRHGSEMSDEAERQLRAELEKLGYAADAGDR
ncbi:MAG: hypothetical protein EXS13_12280 [Planctomycetes bacterium]|nr:hypothetical protein [Planctomycetota bacterium]